MTGHPEENRPKTDGDSAVETQSPLQPSWFGDPQWTTDSGWVGPLVLLAVLAALWELGGRGGIAAWVVIAGSWLVFPPVVPVAIGQFAISSLTTSAAGLAMMLPAEATLLALLAVDLVTDDRSLLDGLIYAGGTVVLAGSLLVVARTAGLLIAGVVALLVLGFVSYLLHRYLLLDLGHLSDEQRTPDG